MHTEMGAHAGWDNFFDVGVCIFQSSSDRGGGLCGPLLNDFHVKESLKAAPVGRTSLFYMNNAHPYYLAPFVLVRHDVWPEKKIMMIVLLPGPGGTAARELLWG